MVGVRTSNRCLSCAKRKVKCDEAWPTCGACKRSKKSCPGPPSSKLKFVHNGHHTVATYDESDKNATSDQAQMGSGATISVTNTEPLGNLVETKITRAEDGRSFRRLRLRPAADPSPGIIRLGEGDRSAAQLISLLESCPQTGFDVCLNGVWDTLTTTPRHLGHSAALRDAVGATVASCYQKSIASLNATLARESRDGGKISIETFRKYNYDFSAVTNSARHVSGLATIMRMRGPPRTHDDFDFILALNNFVILAFHLVRTGEDPGEIDKWAEALEEGAQLRAATAPALLVPTIRLLRPVAQWPCISGLKGRLRESLSTHTSNQERAGVASEAINRLSTTIAELCLLDAQVFLPAMRAGDIVLVPSRPDAASQSPFGMHYEFRDWAHSAIFRLHAFCHIVMNRMLLDLDQLLESAGLSAYMGDEERRTIEEEAYGLSRRIWLSHEHAIRYHPFGSSETPRHLTLSYEAGDAVERAFVLRALWDVNRYRMVSGTTVEEVWTEAKVLSDCMMLTGRVSI
ncbi:Zn(2)-C6 fungal-type DNA-binding domain-containingprotein [Apiospora rasikravindrae]|uniref:Zn(2)-C6 fungal-type DNA-binding domain-containingprotein n=1 Tax=Apiospora rasikravindrae TaxID=990691 RepID=A0ABR1S2U5_9PEZI